jgi:hypothetical protein
MGFNDLIDGCKREWPVIRRAPLTILLSLLTLTVVVSLVEYGLFKETLSRKNELIDTLTKQLAAGSVQPPVPQPAIPAKTGDAIADGNGNVANTGNSATINNRKSPPKDEENPITN